MSEAGVGGKSRRARIATAIIGLVAAGAVTGLVLGAGMNLMVLIFGFSGTRASAGPPFLPLMLGMTIIGAVGGMVPGLVLGMPLHFFVLVRRRWSSALHYAAVGALVAVVTIIIFIVTVSVLYFGGQGQWFNAALVTLLGAAAIAGAAGGWTFWAIHRPDRNKPPVLEDVFA